MAETKKKNLMLSRQMTNITVSFSRLIFALKSLSFHDLTSYGSLVLILECSSELERLHGVWVFSVT